ncbi:MAG: isopentenyl-diphosphate delta-isomerase [Rhodobacteraceae bacterium]|nr:isopentenyl-diphosphate delta-isomerase [Paracoccaceae bacterium]
MNDMIPAWVDGELIPVEKLDVHLRGLRHRAVSVFVMHGHELLLQQRADGKYHSSLLWANTCCTHPLWGESGIECANRRLNEEMGLKDLYPSYACTLEYRADVGNGMIEHEVVDVFLCMLRDKPVCTPNPDEVADVKWVDLYDLIAATRRHPGDYAPWLRIYLKDHVDAIFGTASQLAVSR